MFIKKGNRYVRLFYLCFNCNYCNCWSMVYFCKGIKNKKPKEVTLKDIPIDLEALIHALGGIDNIKESQSQGSKVRFFVENDGFSKSKCFKRIRCKWCYSSYRQSYCYFRKVL